MVFTFSYGNIMFGIIGFVHGTCDILYTISTRMIGWRAIFSTLTPRAPSSIFRQPRDIVYLVIII